MNRIFFWRSLVVCLMLCAVAVRSGYAQAPSNLNPPLSTNLPGPLPARKTTAGADEPAATDEPLARESVLELDGNGSYLELPAAPFNDLTEATVEAWGKWESFSAGLTFFSYGAGGPFVPYVGMVGNAPRRGGGSVPANGSLTFITSRQGTIGGIGDALQSSGDVIPLSVWFHLAMVTGPGGKRLYLNGVLLNQDANTNSFALVRKGANFYFGRSVLTNAAGTNFYYGQMDDIRVWKTARTEAQIRENMFRNLTSREESLAGLWNFNDPAQPGRDASTNGHHCKLMGQAKVVRAVRPATTNPVDLPSIIFGKITDTAGSPVTNASIRLLHQEEVLSSGASDMNGNYSVALLTRYYL